MFETVVAALLPVLIPGVGALVTGLVSLALMGLKNYVKIKTDNALVENALTRISNTVQTVVDSLEQTVVAELRSASSDGKLTKEDAAKIKQKAMNTVMAQLPGAIVSAAELGVNDVRVLVESKIEQAVLKSKGV